MSDQQPPQPPPFHPLFTLISTSPNNGSSTEFHHPTVHYIFSDDPDPHDPITSAALNSLPSTSSPHQSSHDQPQASNHRYLILDLDATGTKITNASSMSPEWAITSAQLQKAPSWEGDAEAEEEGKGRMMLRIEGLENAKAEEAEGRGKTRAREEVGIAGLVERFEREMGQLRRVVEMGGKGGEGGRLRRL